MKRLLIAMLIAAPLTLPVLGQSTAQGSSNDKNAKGPAPILEIMRERVKPGRDAAHEKNEAMYPVLFRKMNFPYYAIGMTAISGRSEAWWLAPVDKYTDFSKAEELIQAPEFKSEMDRLNVIDGEMLSESDVVIATYEKELSYRPEYNVGEQRYMLVDVVKLKPGYVDEYKELLKTINAAHEKLNMDEHMVVYSSALGTSMATFYIFEPLKSMEQMDALHDMHGEAFHQALGPDYDKKRKEFATTALASYERNLFAVNPKMSYVSQDVIATAPDFWAPKHAEQASTPNKSKAGVKPVHAKSGTP
jgi:hypothetical protein